jgi:uncharacterized protein
MAAKMPHDNVYVRLFPSPIHGVGVVAIKDIKKDTLIFQGDDDDLMWIDNRIIEHLGPEIKRLYDDFAVIHENKYGCPDNFNLLTPAWYLNEPKPGEEANVRANADYEFFALRDIKKGEELTVRYRTYSEKPS